MRYAIPALSEGGWIFFQREFGHLRNRKWTSHPKGYYQPGVLAYPQERARALSLAMRSEIQQHGWGRLETGLYTHVGVDKS